MRALAKLEQVLPSRLRHRVNALQSVTVPLRRPGPDRRPGRADRHRRRLPRPRAACASTTAATTAPPARRTVEPYRLVHTGRRWYLRRLGHRPRRLAHLPGRPAPARARPPVRASPRASPPTPTSPATPPGDLHRPLPLPGPVHRARARRGRRRADPPPPRPPSSPSTTTTCLLTAGANSLDELASWLVSPRRPLRGTRTTRTTGPPPPRLHPPHQRRPHLGPRRMTPPAASYPTDTAARGLARGE